MANEIAIKALYKERDNLLMERDLTNNRLNRLISEIETSIELLGGKIVWETDPPMIFDDSNPDYIRSSEEEI